MSQHHPSSSLHGSISSSQYSSHTINTYSFKIHFLSCCCSTLLLLFLFCSCFLQQTVNAQSIRLEISHHTVVASSQEVIFTLNPTNPFSASSYSSIVFSCVSAACSGSSVIGGGDNKKPFAILTTGWTPYASLIEKQVFEFKATVVRNSIEEVSNSVFLTVLPKAMNLQSTNLWNPGEIMKCDGANCYYESFLDVIPKTYGSKAVGEVSIRYLLDGVPITAWEDKQFFKISASQLVASSGNVRNLTAMVMSQTLQNSTFTTMITGSVDLYGFYLIKGGNRTHSMDKDLYLSIGSSNLKNYPLSLLSSVTWTCSRSQSGATPCPFTSFVTSGLNTQIKASDLLALNITGRFYFKAQVTSIYGEQATLNSTIDLSAISLPNLYAEPLAPFISCFSGSATTFSARIFVDQISAAMTIARVVGQQSDFGSSTSKHTTQKGTIFTVTINAYNCQKIQYAETYGITLQNGVTMYVYLTSMIVRLDAPSAVNYYSMNKYAYESYGVAVWEMASLNNQDLSLLEITTDDGTVVVSKRNIYYSKLPYLTGNFKFWFSHKYGGKMYYPAYSNPYLPSSLSNLGCNNLLVYANTAMDYINNQLGSLNLTSVKRISEMDTLLKSFLFCSYGSTFTDNQASLYYFRQLATTVAGNMLTEVEKAKDLMHDMDDYLAKMLKSFTQNILTFTNVTGIYDEVMKNGAWKTALIGNVQLVTSNGMEIPYFPSGASTFLVDSAMDGSNQNMEQYASNIAQAVDALHSLYESSNSTLTLKGFKMMTRYLYSLTETQSLSSGLEANPVNVSITFPKSGIVDNGFFGDYRLATSSMAVSQPQNETKVANTFVIPMVVTAHITRLEDNSILSVSNLTETIKISFDRYQPSRTNYDDYVNGNLKVACVYYDTVSEKWSLSGVTTRIKSSDGFLTIECETTHLSSFAVIYQDVSRGLSGGAIAGIVIGSLVVFGCLVGLIVTAVLVGYFVIYPRVMKNKKISSSEREKTGTTTSTKLETVNMIKSPTVSDTTSPIPLSQDTDKNFTNSLFISEYSSVRTDNVASSPSSASSTMDLVSKKYEILEKIGAGAFGSVFKARYLLYSGKPGEAEYVAIKRVNLTGLSELNEKFQEAVNMFKNKHENIVTLQDAIVDQNTMSLFLAMKYYSFGDLEKKVKAKQRLSEKMLKQIIYQVCKGLNYIQVESGMIHRDVKPSNIFIDSIDEKEQRIRVVLSDFGLAKESDMMSSFSFAGTPYFMSPQLLIGSKYSFNTDIFSLGCSIFIMITFDASQSLAQLYLRNQSNVNVVHSFITESIEKAAPHQYSKEFMDVLLQMLEFDADKRPNAKDILEMSFFKDIQ
ncbi:hypothetical protein C9374_002447 [Naegleria lovaniensis]|uniref:Protein kinase domain-containing protein n=1 Tax=Naegleria lovaniensis TaxID=51637 RepID=A0AA88GUS9_NAELO|nr:uncharacterized protein C9374_002447 [Naegleria lovaniensis]KAG2386703.1 hypothetical protein C9374_002447 [Naegleria lovaniensis]